MKVEFEVKYGKNVIEIPITEKTVPKFQKSGLTDLFSKKVTIYNDIPATDAENRHFDRFVVENCSIQGGYVVQTDGTIQNVVNAQTVITKDVSRYKKPMEYASIPVDLRADYYTAQIGDFIVFDEVGDVVETASEFAKLQTKYKDKGMKITNVVANINGMAVDNVTMTNA